MKQKLFERVKEYFSFLSLTDDQLMDVVQKTFDETKDEDENFQKILNVFYSVVKESFNSGDISLILLSNNFDYNDYSSAVDSLNRFAIFLDKCGITFNEELEKKIKEVGLDLDNTLKKVSEANEDFFDNLNSLALTLFQSSSYFIAEDLFIDLENDIDEECDKSFQDAVYVDDATKQYLCEIGKIPLLTPEEEETLFKAYRETKDSKIRERILVANLRLVVSIASKFNKTTKGVTLLELVSAGNEGLIKALEEYDPEKSKFSTYATYWIRQKIIRWLQSNSSNIRFPSNLNQRILNYKKQRNELENTMGKTLSMEELSKFTGLSIKKILEYEKLYLLFTSVSMDTPIGEEEDTVLADFIEDEECISPEDKAIFSDNSRINGWLSHLSETEKTIVSLRIGLYDGREYSLEEVSSKLCEIGLRDTVLSRQRVEQIESRAMRKLKQIIQKQAEREGNPLVRKIIVPNPERREEYNKVNLEFMKLVKLIRITDVIILSKSIYELPTWAKENLKKCFGDNILAGVPLAPPIDEKKRAAYRVFPILKKKIDDKKEQQKLDNLEEIILPRNIYDYFVGNTQSEIDKAIENLSSSDRLVLSKCYDIFSGEYKSENLASFKDRKDILIILKKIDFNLPKRNKTKKKDN